MRTKPPKETLLTYCKDQIAFYEEGNRKSELNPNLWNNRIDQINKDKIIDVNDHSWLIIFAISLEAKDKEFSEYLKTLAKTYQHYDCPYCDHSLLANEVRELHCNDCGKYLVGTLDGGIRNNA